METQYYQQISEYTDPIHHRSLIQTLPNDIEQLCGFVQNLLVHAYWLGKYDVEVEDSVKHSEMQTRYAKDILNLAASKSALPINKKRIPSERVVSICRDFSLILCAVLRTKGVAARTRCGFATYLTPELFEDHWICEYWDQGQSRWIRVDAQLDSTHLQELNIDFNPCDVPESRFLYAGDAWQLCRNEKASPAKFGILSLNGLPFIKGNLIRDLFSLNKIELLAWDTGWGILPHYMSPILNTDEMDLLDQLAMVSKESDVLKAKQALASQSGIGFPVDWSLTMAPSITDLYAQYS
ncbi:transglutaminase domain-containing protein [Alginatibacterium sediminis]|uniref:Transglutaminase domain-containing protein n=1 Tax=Alginatibacterium sediminis TaxID=2164068 RepID=A0A420EBQ1_9ALTE|nr:transglutaminase domain-containing protein [Alginatibacterium sediminis]RKF18127.1 transglutaminase domain-containing protein [Alginatibacterium sediminis]